MKKTIILLLLAFVLCSATTISNNEKITLASTADIEYVFGGKVGTDTKTAYISIISAATGVQISVGEAIAAKHYAWPTGSKVPITFANGLRNIHLKGAVSDVIVITY